MSEPSGPSEHARHVEHVWRSFLTTGDIPDADKSFPFSYKNFKRFMRMLPAEPRCTLCYAPFNGVGAPVARTLFGLTRSRMNPLWCNQCERFAIEHKGGAEVELSMLFADMRGSTSLAQRMSPSEFSQLIDRFYNVTTDLMVYSNAMIEKLIGDEVAGLYVPGLAGPMHAQVAVETAGKMLRAVGNGTPEGPWAPVGIGVHMGIAFVGAVGSPDGLTSLTALGDAVNTTARLASAAGSGELLVSEDAFQAAGLDATGLEARDLELKGRSEPIRVYVMHAAPG